jgi:hypothetical protein
LENNLFCPGLFSGHIHYFFGEVSPRKNLINVYYNWIEAWDELLNIEFNQWGNIHGSKSP